MKQGRINAWPAFADMMFVLFVCTLLGAAHYQTKNNNALKEVQKFRDENRDLVDEKASLADTIKIMREQLEKGRNECGVAKPLIDGIRTCLSARGINLPEQTDDLPCEVEIGEKSGLRFHKAGSTECGQNTRKTKKDDSDGWASVLSMYQEEARPKKKGNVCAGNEWAGTKAKRIAREISECVVDQSYRFLKDEPDSFYQIKSIFVDGYTDCDGDDKTNWKLGSARALSLVQLMLTQFTKRTDISERALLDLKRKINVRSFGENKQLTNEDCNSQSEETKLRNRRVTISIEQKVTALNVAQSD